MNKILVAIMMSLAAVSTSALAETVGERMDRLEATCFPPNVDFKRVSFIVNIKNSNELRKSHVLRVLDLLGSDNFVHEEKIISSPASNGQRERVIAFKYSQPNISLGQLVLELEQLPGVSVTCPIPMPSGFSAGSGS